MSDQLVSIVQSHLRTSEEVKYVLETASLPIVSDGADPAQGHGLQGPSDARILAVVTHLDPATEEEQGCVFILKPRLRRGETNNRGYIIEHVLPIVGRFSISMAQPRRGTIDLGSPASPSFLKQAPAELTITIQPGHDRTLEPISLLTSDTHGLRLILAETKRLKDLSDANYEPGVSPLYAWILTYISSAQPDILPLIPPDLRHAHRPLHTLLSPASAGQPGDEALDISLIREDWMRSKVFNDFVRGSPETRLKIRIGTFNVNGKLPSQDLSPWVRWDSSSGKEHLIPPLQEISPLTIGESGKQADEAEYFERTEDSISVRTDDTKETGQSRASEKTFVAQSTSSGATPKIAVDSSVPGGDNVRMDENDPDLLVVGFQELDLSTEALLYSTKTTREDAWCAAILAGLGEKAVLYQKLTSKQLVGMLLVTFVRKEIVSCFSDVRTTSVGAGILGLMGNKGATAIRLVYSPPSSPSPQPKPSPPAAQDDALAQGKSTLSSTSAITPPPAPSSSILRPVIITFVNSHLAAFDEMYDRRNADFHDLSKRVLFDVGSPSEQQKDSETAESGGGGASSSPMRVPLTMYQSDALFWMVDLNYRINLPDSDIRTLLAEASESGSLDILQRYDQLKLAMRTKKAFPHFAERKITHRPTYRYSAGVLSDSLGYDVKRKPAWTDRVLYMCSSVAAVQQTSYASHPSITMSDHKPVSADCDVRIPLVDSEKLDAFVRSLWRDVGGFENSEEVPKIKVHSSVLDFGKIYYKRSASQRLQVENVGKIPCTYRFVSITRDAPVHPDWLSIEPLQSLLRPGETLSIELRSYVDKDLAARLNAGPGKLEDTLILHTSFGKDHFVAVAGEFQRTCFAQSLERLTRLPGPVRTLKANEQLLSDEQALNAPREVMRLVNWLMSNATNVEDLFLSPGDHDLVSEIREYLDTGTEFSSISATDLAAHARAFATCLIELLDSMLDPVIPTSLYDRCVSVGNRDEAYSLLDDFPGVSVNVWISVTAFLHFISQQSQSDSHERHVKRLADTFAPVLLREDPSSMSPLSPLGKRQFLLYFIS
ncbi:DNase I-like protein [Panus rudis PR-1116 ss-1]|nr:DNase I-like protein [Panus rudis PR-1116 ss-1]